MTSGDLDSSKQLKPIRPEVLSPENDWPKNMATVTYIKEIYSEHRSFLFQLLHGFLPTQNRLARFELTPITILSLDAQEPVQQACKYLAGFKMSYQIWNKKMQSSSILVRV